MTPLRDLLSDLPVEEVAPRLLGAHLVSRIDGTVVVARLVEVEGYGGVGEDPGSHAYRRRTARNASMFAAPGTLYVYFVYGLHWCCNVVTGPAGTASAVLLRAAEVVAGTEVAATRRGGAQARDLARGPARLARVLAVTGLHDGVDLLDGGSVLQLQPHEGEQPPPAAQGPRVGVRDERPWRWWIPGDPHVSGMPREAGRSR